MESLGIDHCFSGIYKNKRVLITGISGFKGSWLALWLKELGADVVGYSLEPPTQPSHFNLLQLDVYVHFMNINHHEKLLSVFEAFRPNIVFHMAAQPLVRYSYENPIATFETNVIGTLKVFEACRAANVKAIINVTSDKCYANKEWVWGYRENDPMGGFDPYSASKGCSELLTESYRNSFFNIEDFGLNHETLIASVRAGNVIGGGDWAEDRLVPDIIRAAENGEKVYVRNPQAIRPWQHVLEPLSGYLLLGEKLLSGRKEYSGAWNFGPDENCVVTVGELVVELSKFWPQIKYEMGKNRNRLHEANMLKLDCSKAHLNLGWKSLWNRDITFRKTINWYKDYYENGSILSVKHILDYIEAAKTNDAVWYNKC